MPDDDSYQPNAIDGGANGADGDAISETATPTDASVGRAGDAAYDVEAPARADVTAGIANKVEYTLSIEEAQNRIAHAHRKVPAVRSMQRYCDEGKLLAIQIPVTYDNRTHAKPWFINEDSLTKFIATMPRVILGDADDAVVVAATPKKRSGDANRKTGESLATLSSPKVEQDQKADVAPIEVDRDAREVTPSSPAQVQVPQSISLSTILLENARLEERISGRDDVITQKDIQISELKDDKIWLREEVRENRSIRHDVKEISSELLQTIKEMAGVPKLAQQPAVPTQVPFREEREQQEEKN